MQEILRVYDSFEFYVGDFERSINGFIEAIGMKFNNRYNVTWRLDPTITFSVTYAEPCGLNALRPRGRRLQKWVYNRFWEKITQGKYYGRVIQERAINGYNCRHVFRHSNIIVDKAACVFSGTCYDILFIKPIIDFIDERYPCDTASFGGLVCTALMNGLKGFKEEMDYHKSEEGVSAYAEANGFEFLKNGEFYTHNLR